MKPPEPDAAFEISLRPPAVSEFTGQIKVRERLELMVEAAKKRGDVLEHILLSGPSGLGKTTLAYIIANAMGVNIKNTSGPVIEKAGELAGLLTSLENGDVLFIDEIHRLQPAIEVHAAGPSFLFGHSRCDSDPLARMQSSRDIRVSVRCERPEFALQNHTGYGLRDIDRHDVALLCEHFGLQPPESYR